MDEQEPMTDKQAIDAVREVAAKTERPYFVAGSEPGWTQLEGYPEVEVNNDLNPPMLRWKLNGKLFSLEQQRDFLNRMHEDRRKRDEAAAEKPAYTHEQKLAENRVLAQMVTLALVLDLDVLDAMIRETVSIHTTGPILDPTAYHRDYPVWETMGDVMRAARSFANVCIKAKQQAQEQNERVRKGREGGFSW